MRPEENADPLQILTFLLRLFQIWPTLILTEASEQEETTAVEVTARPSESKS